MKPCCSKAEVKRGPWTPDEDELLSNYVRREGEGRWRTLPKKAGLLRCGKSCRLRWMNYLRPSIKRGRIAPDEEDLILRLHRLLGNRWALIAGRIPGRTDNEIKNYWNTHLSKKLISQGIDPRTHKPLLNPNPSSSSAAAAAAAAAASGSQTPAPKSNPNPIKSTVALHEKGYDSVEDIMNKTNENLEGTMKLDQDHNWLNSNGLMMDLQKCNEEDDIGYCTDDDEGIFSSFLNSLINEEMVLDQQQQTNVITPIEALATSVQPYGDDSIWEAALPSSTAAVNEDERKQLDAGQDLQ